MIRGLLGDRVDGQIRGVGEGLPGAARKQHRELKLVADREIGNHQPQPPRAENVDSFDREWVVPGLVGIANRELIRAIPPRPEVVSHHGGKRVRPLRTRRIHIKAECQLDAAGNDLHPIDHLHGLTREAKPLKAA